MATQKTPVLKQFMNFWTLWNYPNEKKPWSEEQRCKIIKEEGFTTAGIGASPEVAEIARKAGLDCVVYIDGSLKTYQDRLNAAVLCKPSRINVQACDHDTTPAEAVKVWIEMVKYAKTLGLDKIMDLEVHRDTCTETPEKTYEIARLYKQKTGQRINLCFDFSHFAVVKHISPPYRNRLLVDHVDLTQSSLQLHLRPFNGHHCQVPLSNGKGVLTNDGKAYLEFVSDLLTEWIKGPQAKAGATLYVCPEFGPFGSGYGLSTFPDVYKDACLLRKETDKIWKSLVTKWKSGKLK